MTSHRFDGQGMVWHETYVLSKVYRFGNKSTVFGVSFLLFFAIFGNLCKA